MLLVFIRFFLLDLIFSSIAYDPLSLCLVDNITKQNYQSILLKEKV